MASSDGVLVRPSTCCGWSPGPSVFQDAEHQSFRRPSARMYMHVHASEACSLIAHACVRFDTAWAVYLSALSAVLSVSRGVPLRLLAGWLAASPLLGAYTVSATSSVGDIGKTLVPAWGVSIPLALSIRALEKGGEVPPVAFVITSMIFTLVALGAWRALYTVVNPTSTDTYKKGGLLDGFRMITTLLRRW